MIEEALARLDDTLHVKARFGIMTLLLAWGEGDFASLKRQLDLTDGNLGAHLRVLEDARLVAVKKRFEGRKPRTSYRVTPRGRRMFEEYLDALEEVVRAAPRSRPGSRGSAAQKEVRG